MLDNAAILFENKKVMLKKLKKKTYEANMKEFRANYRGIFDEMTALMDSSEDKPARAKEIGEGFTASVWDAFSKNGKISGVNQFDLNLFMIYYVFPAILLTYHDDAKLLCDELCASWNSRLKSGQIGYKDYDTLYKSFNEKILGLF